MRMLVLAMLLCLIQATQLNAQASLFEGKTIRIVVGLPASDAYDLYPRMLANYMGKYISGNPAIMVQNMPGTSSMIAAKYVGNVGRPDGLTLAATLPSLYFRLTTRPQRSEI